MSNYSLNNFRSLSIINENELLNLNFSENDVLILPEDKRVRLTNIDKAIALHKSKLYKTAIIIKTSNGLTKIETGIVSFANGFLFTTNRFKIPIQVVYSVDFYS